MLATSDPRSDSLSRNARYHSRLKPSNRWSERALLNENSATIAIGRNMHEEERGDVEPQRPHSTSSRAALAAERR